MGAGLGRKTQRQVKPNAKTKRRSPVLKAPWFTAFAGANNKEYIHYMQTEWGWEKRGDAALFEKLCLEGQQAGLSWATVLAKRSAYRKAFHRFNVARVASMTARDVDKIIAQAAAGPGGRDAVIMHKGKLMSITENARCVL